MDHSTESLASIQTSTSGTFRVPVIAISLFAILSLLAAATSQGFLEADACTHYIFARFALREPHYLVNIWGRPFCTILFSLPAALFGVMGVRALSLLLAILIALLTCRVARDQGYRRFELVLIALLAQPLYFLHSFSELTELPFAMLLIAAFLAYQSRRWLLMAILLALGPTARPEGYGFLLLGAVTLLLHRRWRYLLILPLPLLVWTCAGWFIDGRPDYGSHLINPLLWLPKNWPYSPNSTYASGPLLLWAPHPDGTTAVSFLLRLPIVVSPIFFPFMWLGIWRSVRDGGIRSHQDRCRLLIAVLPMLILAGHSFLWWRGLMASNGELRYLLVVAPFWALLSGRGWEWAFDRMRWTRPILWASLAALAPLAIHATYPVVPLKMYDDTILARQIAQWYRSDPQLQRDYPRITASCISLYLYLDISTYDRNRAEYWGIQTVTRAPRGTLLIWDPIYGQTNSDSRLTITRRQLLDSGWILCRRFSLHQVSFEVFLSPRTATGLPTADRPMPPYFPLPP